MNPDKDPQELTFQINLPEDAFVHKFSMWVSYEYSLPTLYLTTDMVKTVKLSNNLLHVDEAFSYRLMGKLMKPRLKTRQMQTKSMLMLRR